MKIPKTIKLCGKDYKVIKRNRVSDKELHNGAELFGMVDIDKCEIVIDKSMSKEKEKEIILHECIEGIEKEFNMNLKHDYINIFTIEILSLIKNNKLDFLK